MVNPNKVIETAAGGNLSVLITKLASLAIDKVSELRAISGNIEWLKEELEIYHAVLLDLSNEEHPSHQMKLWKTKIIELSYDMEDLIDKFETTSKNSHARRLLEAEDPDFIQSMVEALGKFTDRIKTLPSRYGVANEIQRLKDRFAMSEDRHKRLKTSSYGEGSTSNGDDAIAIRDLASYADPAGLVGIDGPREDIISCFKQAIGTSLHGQRMVVAIVGFGGLGKTTLAKQVFDKIGGGAEFDCTAFVTVSRNPDINRILKDILEDFKSPDTPKERQNRRLIDEVRKCVEGKRYLVVVDDVWSREAWRNIEAALYDNNRGSRIIVTTRNTAVADECCRSKSSHIYKLHPLNDDQSEQLFITKAFPDRGELPSNLKDLCTKVLKKCGGSPLAILTLSGLLANKETRGQWEYVLDSISSAVSEDSDVEMMRKILSFSYFDLPYHLRTCLLYLSIFPEDAVIRRKRLVNRWIAEGFISAEVGNKARTGDCYFNELISRCLIQPVSIKYNGQARACKVHDTILDFIVSKSTEENFVTFYGAQEGRIVKQARNLSIQDIKKFTGQVRQELHPARSLTAFGRTDDAMIFFNSILRFTSLRVVDLVDVSLNDVKQNVVKHTVINLDVSRLSQLKYMALGNNQDEYFRSLFLKFNITGIINLQCLETLDLSQIQLSQFPEDIYKLQQLARLFVGEYVILPKGIGEMKALEELKFISSGYCSLEFLQELNQLTNLRSVGIYYSGQERYERGHERESVLITSLYKLGMCKLQSVTIIVNEDLHIPLDDFNGLSWHKPLLQLRKFQMGDFNIHCYRYSAYFTKVPEWMSSLNLLEKLKLWVKDMGQRDLEILGELRSLLCLDLAFDEYPGEGLAFRGSTRFQCLKRLKIVCYCRRTMLTLEAGSLLRLENLEIYLKGTQYPYPCSYEAPPLTPLCFSFHIGNLCSLTHIYVNVDRVSSMWSWPGDDDPDVAAETIRKTVNSLAKTPKFKTIYTDE